MINKKIDEELDKILRASGSALLTYIESPGTSVMLSNMREAMRKIMSDSYIKGSNDNFEALKNRN